MKKFKYWLVRFVVEIDSTPLDHLVVVEMPEAVSARVCAALLDRFQRTLFTHWPEVKQDKDCPCANEGTHRQTPWFFANVHNSAQVTVCVYWAFSQGLTRGMAAKLKQVGSAWTKVPI